MAQVGAHPLIEAITFLYHDGVRPLAPFPRHANISIALGTADLGLIGPDIQRRRRIYCLIGFRDLSGMFVTGTNFRTQLPHIGVIEQSGRVFNKSAI